MADEKRNPDQQQGGNEGPDRRRQRDRKPGSGGAMESPGSTPTRREDDRDEQE